MGKVEILTLIAGVVLSIALALIVVPMFGNTSNMAEKQKIHSELISVKNAINMVANTEPKKLEDTPNEAISQYLSGMTFVNEANGFKSMNYDSGKLSVAYATATKIATITFDGLSSLDTIFKDNVDTLEKICDGGDGAKGTLLVDNSTTITITCAVKIN